MSVGTAQTMESRLAAHGLRPLNVPLAACEVSPLAPGASQPSSNSQAEKQMETFDSVGMGSNLQRVSPYCSLWYLAHFTARMGAARRTAPASQRFRDRLAARYWPVVWARLRCAVLRKRRLLTDPLSKGCAPV